MVTFELQLCFEMHHWTAHTSGSFMICLLESELPDILITQVSVVLYCPYFERHLGFERG